VAVAIRIALLLFNGRSRIQIELLKQQTGDSPLLFGGPDYLFKPESGLYS
jgi:hypothetical protein